MDLTKELNNLATALRKYVNKKFNKPVGNMRIKIREDNLRRLKGNMLVEVNEAISRLDRGSEHCGM